MEVPREKRAGAPVEVCLGGCFRFFHSQCLTKEGYCVTCVRRRKKDEARPRDKAQGNVVRQYEIDVNKEYKVKEWREDRVQTPKKQLTKRIFNYRSDVEAETFARYCALQDLLDLRRAQATKRAAKNRRFKSLQSAGVSI